jgi:hypothetical protein
LEEVDGCHAMKARSVRTVNSGGAKPQQKFRDAEPNAKTYPGALATPQQVHALAEEYRRASHALLQLGRPGKPLTRTPFRLTAIHAIELYLNAVLLQRGHAPNQIRKLQHDLWARTELAMTAGLHLRKRTMEHLQSLSRSREYLVTRYGPELAATTSQINRLTATLDEVGKKVAPLISCTEIASTSGGR